MLRLPRFFGRKHISFRFVLIFITVWIALAFHAVSKRSTSLLGYKKHSSVHQLARSRVDPDLYKAGLPSKSYYLSKVSDDDTNLSSQTKKADDNVKESVVLNSKILKETQEKRAFTKAVLFGLVSNKNKGDSALTVGAFIAVGDLNVTLEEYFFLSESGANFAEMEKVIRRYSPSELVLIAQGGGYIGLYDAPQELLKIVIQKFREYTTIVLGQSVYAPAPSEEERVQAIFASGKDVTLITRDRYSYNLSKRIMPSLPIVLSPDVATRMGLTEMVYPPMYDIIWMRRGDKETALDETLTITFPRHVSFIVRDWKTTWRSHAIPDEVQGAWVHAYSGLLFLQRGRVVVTDRLHGVILASLLNKPIIILDNVTGKLSHYRDTWMRNMRHVIVTRHPEEARDKAIEVLKTYDKDMPSMEPFSRTFHSFIGGYNKFSALL